MFQSTFHLGTFTVKLSDGQTLVELVRNGADGAITPENCREWISLCLQRRLHESRQQVQAIRDGLASAIPLDALSFFSPSDLESWLCGKPDFDVEVLKAHTVYDGSLTSKTPHVQFFWNVLNEMTLEQKTQFLKFSWARSRLPSAAQFGATRFKIAEPKPIFLQNPDIYLPSANTCFFTISLPPYSSQEILKQKLLYAIKVGLIFFWSFF